MTNLEAPRRFTPGAAGLEPSSRDDQRSRLAARRSFVALKHSFLDALDGIPAAAWLVIQVQGAEDPVDLWLLRAPVFSALSSAGAAASARDEALRRDIDAMFPDLDDGIRFFAGY